ncbi:MAG: response regulator transcription factor [Anaeroplasmataceae bacterium]|nr:response regulator transcription factor [Anaeroplasmataceae bacterium]MDE6414033.1 response regulator transcription factor [Anaeroplasmataceae bacterium]
MRFDCIIIDDEKLLADSTAEYFNLFGVSTIALYSASECRSFFEKNSASICLLDINLNDGSGFELCKEIREKLNLPILFISARTSDDDKIIALNIGGDDYIQKPYSLGVLLAKVKAVLKRYKQSEALEYFDGRLQIDFEAKTVRVNNQLCKLTFLEFKLLSYLVKNQGKVVSKEQLFESVWEDRFTQDGTLNVHIRKLREAIEIDPNHPEYIITIWKDGYIFKGGRL